MNLRPALLLTILISTIVSCTKIKTTDIGSDLIPPIDNINTFDSNFTVVTRNFYDTGLVYPLRNDNLVLGRISNDPLFGKTTAIVNLEVRPDYFPYRFRGHVDSLKLDSIVLVLSYRGVWGDTSNPSAATQTLRVYELDPNGTKPLQPDSVYSTRTVIAHKPTPLGSVTFNPRNLSVDTLKPYAETINKNQIRIKLDPTSIQQRLFFDTTRLNRDSLFQDKITGFTGFAVVPDTGAVTSNNLIVINLTDTNTKVAFYYTAAATGATKRDTVSAYYRFSSTSGFSNNIIRNPSSPAAEFTTTLGAGEDNLVYLESRPDAPYTRIRIPRLDSLRNCIVHRAELIVEQVRMSPSNPMDDYFTPPGLFLSAFSTDSSRRFMLPSSDVQFTLNGVSNLADFGAFPNRRTINNESVTFYAFNVTRYIQGIATNKNRNYDLVLWAPFADYIYAVESFNSLVPITGSTVLNPLAIGRIRVGGGNHSTRPMKLRIIYTRI